MKNKSFVIALIAIFAVFAALIGYGCHKGGKASEQTAQKLSQSIARPFEASAQIKLNGMDLTADFNKTAASAATVTISKPEALKGMSAQYDGENITVGYKGMSVELGKGSAIAENLIKLLTDAIDKAAAAEGVKLSADENSLRISGDGESGSFNVVLNKDDYSIASVTLPEAKFECKFSDVCFKQD